MPPNDPKITADPILHRVLDDVAKTQSDLERRRGDAILARDRLFEVAENDGRRLIAYLTGPGGGEVHLADAAPIGSMLDAIGECENLDLMLNSPGGSGEMAEKLIAMCREHCRHEFRVIVPNFAKSAATMIALGADVIVMGYLSELGPIDPQYMISVGDVAHMVSGQSFIQAYDTAQEKVNEAMAAGESPVGYLQSLSSSTMEPAFIEHCRRGVQFSRDLAKKMLLTHQLPKKHANTERDHLEALAATAAEDLLSANARFSHGRLIGAEEARDQVGLNVEVLPRDDERWEAYWELYVRAEVYMQSFAPMGDRPVSKIFFDRSSTLPAF